MAAEILTDAALWVGGYDLRGNMNAIAVEGDTDIKDCTTFGDGTRTYQFGMKVASFSGAGFLDSPIDAVNYANWGSDGVPVTIGKSRAEGAIAFGMNALSTKYNNKMAMNELWSFAVTGQTSRRSFGRGRVMSIVSGASATANGTGRLLRGISVNKKAFALLHVTAASGTTPTMDVIIQSDDNVGFTTPTTRGTFSQVNAIASQLIDIDGAITDTYWRARYTIGGTGPSFTFAVSLLFEEAV